MAPQVTQKTNNKNRDLSPGVDRPRSRSISIPNLSDSTINVPFLQRPVSLDQYTGIPTATGVLRATAPVFDPTRSAIDVLADLAVATRRGPTRFVLPAEGELGETPIWVLDDELAVNGDVAADVRVDGTEG